MKDLERLALESPAVRSRFADALADEAYYASAWTWEEAQYARAHLLEADGRYAEAGNVLASLIHWYLSRDAVEEARGLYERLQGYGANCPEFPDIAARMAALVEAPRPEVVTAEGQEPTRPVKILFVGGIVGGNEIQERGDAWVVSELERLGAGVTLPPYGMGRELGPFAERIRQLLPSHDAAVIMRFVRTELGRAAREDVGKAGKRWVACTGHGRESMLRAVLNAAVIARGRMGKEASWSFVSGPSAGSDRLFGTC